MRPVSFVNLDPRLVIESASVIRCIRQFDALPAYVLPEGSIEIAFVGEKECRRLHETFFQDPEVTDVMTFPGEEEDQHAGDIAICPAVAAACSGSLFARELTLYLVHACLHLAGFRDQDEGSRRAMRRAEGIILSHLHRTGGILVAEWKDYPASPEA